ncbi:hypothetical protein [Micrococcus luteus]|uniref:hypothetical protein n=1 Tax=Micrococcus luteus TaxID=1270 RepID=UPI003329227B
MLTALLLLSACGQSPQSTQPSTSPPALTVSGTVTVKDFSAVTTMNEVTCTTRGGYSDIQEGAQVVVTDASSTTIALGQLAHGSWDRHTGCVFFFNIPDVPADQKFYGVEVSHRGRLQYTAEQVVKPLALTIG